MTWKELQDYIKGKLFLVGLTFVNREGNLIEQYQTHGIISDLTDDGLFKIQKEDGSIFQMPYDNETIQKAENGEYREHSTGLIIKDPDFIMTWKITINENDNTEKIKRVGFITAN